MVKKPEGLDDETSDKIAKKYSDMFGEGFLQDVHIWKNKSPIQNPLLCEEDGPVYQLRRWYEQFYVDVADVTAEMTQRFEFEVDTTHANESWQREVEENLRRRQAEDEQYAGAAAAEPAEPGRARRDHARRGLMVSFAPLSEETHDDQRRYLEGHLVEVSCLDCLARVRVRKQSEFHTSIQWDGEASAALRRAQPRPRREAAPGAGRLRQALGQHPHRRPRRTPRDRRHR